MGGTGDRCIARLGHMPLQIWQQFLVRPLAEGGSTQPSCSLPFTVSSMTITTHELLSSHNRTLLAKCQMVEFQSWGGTIVETCWKQIADHQELKDRYVSQMMASRAEEAERFKKALNDHK